MTTTVKECDHIFRHLRDVPISVYDGAEDQELIFSHIDDIFFCEKCLIYQVKDFDASMYKSIYTHNVKGRAG